MWRFRSNLPTGECTTFTALGGGGVRDLRLTLFDDEGAEVATDAVPGEGGLVHVCPHAASAVRRPPPTTPYYLVLEAHEGTGAAVVEGFGSAPGTGHGFDALFAGLLAPRVPFRKVEQQLAESRSALRARGLLPLGPPILDSVAEGEVLRRTYPLDAGRCYVAVARAGAGLRDVDLFLFDPTGAEVARDLDSDAEPRLEHCPDQSGRFTVEVRAFQGAGALGLMVLDGPASDHPDPPPPKPAVPPEGRPDAPSEGDPMVALTTATTALEERGYGAPLFVVRDGTIAPGEAPSHEVLLGPGCGVVVGAASGSDMDLDLYLSDAGGQPIDRDTGVDPTARVSACPTEATPQRVTVKAYGRDGRYALAVLHAPAGIRNVQDLRLEEAVASFRARTSSPRGRAGSTWTRERNTCGR